jgi:hypothetical protein
MILRNYGLTTMPDGTPLNPGTLNKWLRESKFFSVGHADIDWSLVVLFANLYLGASLSYREISDHVCCAPSDPAFCEEARATFYTSLGYPLPIRRATYQNCLDWYQFVDQGNGTCPPGGEHPTYARHAEILLGNDASQWWVADPLDVCGGSNPLYPEFWDRLRVVVPASAPTYSSQEIVFPPLTKNGSSKVSSQLVAAANPVRLSLATTTGGGLFTDSAGRRTGVDSTGTVFAEIPGSYTLSADAITDDVGDAPALPVVSGPSVSAPSEGSYSIAITASVADTVVSTVSLLAADGSSIDRSWKEFIGGGQTRHHAFNVPAVLRCSDGLAGDVVALPSRLVIPSSIGPESWIVTEPDLGAAVYLRRPAAAGFDTFSPAKGARCIVAGQLAGVGSGLTLAATSLVSLPPSGGNHAPAAARDSITVTRTKTRIAKSRLLANDTDPDGQAVTILGVGLTPISRCTVGVVGDSVEITLVPGFDGATEFIYTVGDGVGGIGAASVRVLSALVDAPAPSPISSFEIIRLTPNPAGREVAVDFRLPTLMDPRVEVVDVAGRRIMARQLMNAAAGDHHLMLSLRGVPPGTYFVRLVGADRVASQKLLIIE